MKRNARRRIAYYAFSACRVNSDLLDFADMSEYDYLRLEAGTAAGACVALLVVFAFDWVFELFFCEADLSAIARHMDYRRAYDWRE